MGNYREETLSFYDNVAADFKIERNSLQGFDEIYSLFLSYLKAGSKILDFGCGTGRDSLYFKKHGYDVTALDGSAKMCEITKESCDVPVLHVYFEDFKEENQYDGIWACASLLHLPKDNLVVVLQNCANALKKDGYMYVCFKRGDFEGFRGTRYYFDMEEETFKKILELVPDLEVVEVYYNESKLESQPEIRWINFVLKKRLLH